MSAARPMTFLYEDSRGPTREFGLHKLIKACVFDEVDGDRPFFERMLKDARPLKGSAKLLRACAEDLPDIAYDGRTVITVFDEDRVRDLLGLAPDTPEEEVLEAIKAKCKNPPNLVVFLLVRNAETVIGLLRSCNLDLDEQLVKKALHKNLEARDVLFNRASVSGMQQLRRCVLDANESLKRIVTGVCELVRPALAAQGQG